MSPDPRATYRVQLHAGFTFDQAAAIVPYLAELGVSHLYCSPYLQAAKGSVHGYDVVDHSRISPELGGEEGHARLVEALAAAGLKQLLDIVPNHMAVGARENRWWWDVLENGPFSRYAAYFDLEWDPPEAKLRDTVLLPVLEDHYGRVLERGLLALRRDGGSFTIAYHDHLWPVEPSSTEALLAAAAEAAASDELAFVADALGRLAIAEATDLVVLRRRHRHKEVLRAQLERLCREQPAVAAAVDAQVERANQDPDRLDALLARQNYRLAFWRTAQSDLGYRRFFDVNTLVGLRVENDRVFLDTHDRVLRLLEGEVLDGLRIDHPDGLREPLQYLARLQSARPGTWVVVEKILAAGERLPESWPVAGTTGYDFLSRVNALFVDPEGEAALTAFYGDFTGERRTFAEVLLEKKRQVLRDVLGSDVNRLTALLHEICEAHRRQRDYTRHEVHESLREAIAQFPVYRSYCSALSGEVSTADAAVVQAAIEGARAARPDLDPALLDFLRDLLLLRARGPREDELVMRFQQVTGPAMAKGAEDTAFYDYNRLVSLNEVGGDPGLFSLPLEAFHDACGDAQRRWPRGLLASSTHDSKRSEDVRARLALLAELPERWMQAVWGWAERNRPRWAEGQRDANAEYLYYQTLVGAWPIETDRMHAYMEKAAREAKARTSWMAPDAEFEKSLHAFVEETLGDPAFREEVARFVEPLVQPGRITSLAQLLLKLTAPGVPDFYQGTEVWDLSLVDPDNRRPVDYGARRALLAALADASPEQVLARMDEGAPKMWVTRQGLAARAGHAEAFGSDSTYAPLAARGQRARHVVAFGRGQDAVTVVPRHLLALGGDWGDTTVELPAGEWTNVMSRERVAGGAARLDVLLARFPVALLTRA